MQAVLLSRQDPTPESGAVAHSGGTCAARKTGQVEEVISMQVAEENSVDAQRVGKSLQAAERARAQIEQDAPEASVLLVLHQVAARGGIRAGIRAGAADDRQSHQARTQANCGRR